MDELHYGRGYVYRLEYHLIIVTKYRKSIIKNNIKTDLYRYIRKSAEQHNYKIITMNGEPDHVHLLIELSPQQPIPTMVKQLKGESTRWLFMKHPELKTQLWGGHLWSPSYFITTISEQTEENIKHYIEMQGKK